MHRIVNIIPNMEENKPERIRRTRYELRTAVLKAVSELSKVKQLSLITMVDVGKQSGIRVEVLQRSYNSIEEILALYASSVDYWIANILAPRHPLDLANEEFMQKAFVSLAKNLLSDRQMQSLLMWELSEENATTRRLATSREEVYAQVFAHYKHLFEGTGIHIDIIAALINAGIYYLILHRKRSTFWGVNYCNATEQARMMEAIEQVISLVFTALRERNRTLDIARKLKQRGVASDVIADCTGLTEEEVQELQ